MEESILGDMSSFLDKTAEKLDNESGQTVIRPTSTLKEKNLKTFYSKLEENGINTDELGDILECEKDMLVLSGAGAGKSTALNLKIIRDQVAGEMQTVTTVNSVYGNTQAIVPAKILVSTFLKTGAEELERNFKDWCRKLGVKGIDYSNIVFKTIHAEVYDALKSMGVPLNMLKDSQQLIKAVMNKYSIRSENSTSRAVTLDELKDMESIVAYARNRLDDKRHEQPLMDEYRMDETMLNAVLTDYKLFRQATGGMDFEDMQEMLLEALRMNPNVVKFIQERYDYVYIDEFQDTSQLQYEILKYYFEGSKRVIAIGDDDQTIYSWRGSDIDIISHRFEEDLQPEVLKLTTNYRCKSNILDFVKTSIEMNSKRHSKELKSYKQGGSVDLVMYSDVNYLVEEVKKDLANGGKVGVLARVNADLLIPAILLELDGTVDFAISKAVNLDGRIARQVFGVMDLVTKRHTKDFEQYLRLFVQRYDWKEADRLNHVLNMNKGMNLYNIPEADLDHSLPSLGGVIKGLRKAKQMGDLEAYLFLLGTMLERVYVGKTLYVKKARELVQFVIDLIMKHKDIKEMTLGQIEILFRTTIPERLARRANYKQDAYVKLTTVHEAKGKEWESVYIWNDVNGAFPNQVGNRDITLEEMEEERRVHYIAVTRAKNKCVIFTDSKNMSPFLKECDHTMVGGTHEAETINTSIPTRVFKREAVEVELTLDEILRNYEDKLNTEGNIYDERLISYKTVQNSYSFEQILVLVKEEFVNIKTIQDDEKELDYFFSKLAEQVIDNE